MGFFEFLFHREEEPPPADGYHSQPPANRSIIKPGKYSYSNREISVLGFDDDGLLCATLFLCLGGECECSEWGTLLFHRLSHSLHEETWEATVGRCGIVIDAKDYGGSLKLKIEVDR